MTQPKQKAKKCSGGFCDPMYYLSQLCRPYVQCLTALDSIFPFGKCMGHFGWARLWPASTSRSCSRPKRSIHRQPHSNSTGCSRKVCAQNPTDSIYMISDFSASSLSSAVLDGVLYFNTVELQMRKGQICCESQNTPESASMPSIVRGL